MEQCLHTVKRAVESRTRCKDLIHIRESYSQVSKLRNVVSFRVRSITFLKVCCVVTLDVRLSVKHGVNFYFHFPVQFLFSYSDVRNVRCSISSVSELPGNLQ